MASLTSTARPSTESLHQREGLYRTVIAGPGRSLVEAFANLDRAPQAVRVLRHANRNLLSARVTLIPEEGQGYWELTRIRDDLYVILSDFMYARPRYEFVPGDGLVQFNFKLSGDLTYGVSDIGPLRFTRPALHLWRQPKGVDMREWTAARAHERMLTISLRPEFLKDYLLSTGLLMPARLQAFVNEPSGQVDFYECPLSSQMLAALTRLLENPYEGALYLMYQEALILELLCVTAGELSSRTEGAAGNYSERELRAFGVARQLLMKQFAPAPAVRQIARAVGLSEKSLARGFKSVYGETVSDFGLRCRMQYALTLLQDQHWSVDRTSEAVGYAHPTSFTTAFRRQFGVRPIDVKPLKSRNRQPSV